MKTRLLNASHCAIGCLGSLAGLRQTHEVMREPVFRTYVERFMDVEVAPLLPRVPGIDLGDYTRALMERLANPKIGDELARLCRNGSSKLPAHVLPSIALARRRGSDHALLTMAVAGWFRYLRGSDERDRRLVVDDPLADRLGRAARAGGCDPRRLLAESPRFGELAVDEGFATSLEQALTLLDRHGVRAALGGLSEDALAA
jgi:fructuronate reductase/mannitol 2-dehydrogenase